MLDNLLEFINSKIQLKNPSHDEGDFPELYVKKASTLQQVSSRQCLMLRHSVA